MDLFIKEWIHFEVTEDVNVFIPHVYESLFSEMENESHEELIADIIYRPNSLPHGDVDVFSSWWRWCISSTLFNNDIMKMINSEGKSSLIIGDVNICL